MDRITPPVTTPYWRILRTECLWEPHPYENITLQNIATTRTPLRSSYCPDTMSLSRNTVLVYERVYCIRVNSVVKYIDYWSSLKASPLWGRYAPKYCSYTYTSSIILIPGYKLAIKEARRQRILHPCKRRSVVSWLLKLFESPAPMRTLRSKIPQLHVYLLDQPNTRIQTRHIGRPEYCTHVNGVVKYLDYWSSLKPPPLRGHRAPKYCISPVILVPRYKVII
jgi:hypothetical protein